MVNSISWHRTWLFCVLISRRYTWADLMRKFNGVCWWKCNCPNAHPSVTRLKIYIFAYCLRPNPQKPSYPYLFFFLYLCLADRTDMSVSDSLTLTTARDSRAQENLLSFYLIFGALSLSLTVLFSRMGLIPLPTTQRVVRDMGFQWLTRVSHAAKSILVGLLPLALLLRTPDVQLCRFTCHFCVF